MVLDAAQPARVLILTADTGFGHRRAAGAIAAALNESHGALCTVEIENPLNDRRVLPALRRSQADYDRVVREAPEFFRLRQKAAEGRLQSTVTARALTVLLYETVRDVVRRRQPDVIVSTHPFYAHPLAALFAVEKRRVPVLVVLTDLQTIHRVWFHRSVDLCLVPTEVARRLARPAGLAEDQIRITGIPVDPALVNERRTQAGVRAELGLEPDRATLLAVGSKRIRKFLDPLRAINHSGLPLQLIAVAGGDRELLLQLQAVEWHLPTRVFGYVEEMSPLMRAADCLLSKAGGLIVSESLACGLPMLVVDVLPGQEDGNAAFVVDGGAGERGDNPIEVLEIMAHWMRDGGALLSQRAENAKRLGRPRAAFDVADLAWQAARDGERREPDRRLPGRNGVLDLLRRYGVSWSGALEPVTRRRRSRAGR